MALRNDQQEYFRAPPEIFFEGFRSDAYSLQKAGWNIVQVWDDYTGSIFLTLKHSVLELALQTEKIGIDRDSVRAGMQVSFRISRVGPPQRVQIFQDFSTGSLIDCTPTFSKMDVLYGDWAIFGPPVSKTVEVLVEPSSVSECLDLIQRLQSPKLAEIRAKQRDQDLRTAYTQHINAKIMSVA